MAEGIDEPSVIAVTDNASALVPNYTITSLTREAPFKISQAVVTHVPQFIQENLFLSQLPPHLRLPPEDIRILISVKSGAEQAAAVFDDVLKPVLNNVGLNESSYQVLKTESSDSIKQFTNGRLKERATEGVAQTVLLLSGDGGIVDLVNGLLSDADTSLSKFIRPKIVLFPLGTGNALFHSLHHQLVSPSSTSQSTGPPSDLVLAFRTLLFGTPNSLPLFRTTFSPNSRLLSNYGRTALPLPASNALYGTIVASYGLHATLVADSDTAEWRQHGAARFGMVAKELLSPSDGSEPHAYRAKVTLHKDRDVVLDTREHGYILLTLVSNLEKTFTISPDSRPLDGQLRVVHFGPERGEEVGRIMGLAYQGGKHVGEEKVAYEQVEGMRIEFLEQDGGNDGEVKDDTEGRWRRVCIDGLIVRVEEGGWMDVHIVAEGERILDVLRPPGGK